MPFVTPRTWVTNEIVTAAELNSNVRDNMNWVNLGHGARVWHNVDQSCADSTDKVLAFNSEDLDSDAFHNTATNNSRLTIPSGLDGFYLIGGHISFASNSGNGRRITVRLNGATDIAVNFYNGVGAVGQPTRIEITTPYVLNATDYVELVAWQNSGGALNALTGSGVTNFWCVRIGA